MDKDFWKWYAENPSRALECRCAFAEAAWLESARRADRKARLECERIALQYSQAYGQIDDAMAIARDIRATIKED